MNKADLIAGAGRVPLIGGLFRWFANRYREGSTVSILSGYAEGMVWCRHHRYVNGYWTGHYELPTQEAIARELRQGDVFWDVGANAGFFSLLACRIVGPAGNVVSFDPDPRNCQSMQEACALNDLRNWSIVPQAISSDPGMVSFCYNEQGDSFGHLGKLGGGNDCIEVEATTLDRAVKAFRPPQVIKMDIEGAEGLAMIGSSHMLNSIRPTWIIELHGMKAGAEVTKALAGAGYRLSTLDGTPLSSDPEYDRNPCIMARAL